MNYVASKSGSKAMFRKAKPSDAIIGQNIRRLRALRARSQETVANAIGTTFQQIQKYETGHNRASASTLVLLAKYFVCPITEFFTGVEGVSLADPMECSKDDAMLLRDYGKLSRVEKETVREIARKLRAE